MSVLNVDGPPTEIGAAGEGPELAEPFTTELEGKYTWGYQAADEQVRRLYRIGKELAWDAEKAIDWERTHPKTETPIEPDQNPLAGWKALESMSEDRRLELDWHLHAWEVSQLFHAEQGALLVASQLVTCAPTYDAKLFASSQTFDEARHIEVFGKYLADKVGFTYPINAKLKALLDRVLTDPRWDLKFVGMQLIIEALALAAFQVQKSASRDPLLRDMVDLVIRDEARHVAFGINYMDGHVRLLTDPEIEDRAEFGYEACTALTDRLVPLDVLRQFGLDEDEGERVMRASSSIKSFEEQLFSRAIPNLVRVGLMTDGIRPHYESRNLLRYEAGLPATSIDWSTLEEPLPSKG